MNVKCINEGFNRKYGDMDSTPKVVEKKPITEEPDKKTLNTSKVLKEGVIPKRRTPVVFTESQIKKLSDLVSKLDEGKMSPEDERDNQMLRDILNKKVHDGRAKLTPEEQKLLDTYDIEYLRAEGGKYDNKGPRLVDRTGRKLMSASSSSYYDWKKDDAGKWSKSRWTPNGKNNWYYGANKDKSYDELDKEKEDFIQDAISNNVSRNWKNPNAGNMIDRARKAGTRTYANTVNNVILPSSSPIMGKDDKTFQEKERSLQNKQMSADVNDMKNLITQRNKYRQNVQDAEDRFVNDSQRAVDKYNAAAKTMADEIAWAGKRRDNDVNYNTSKASDETRRMGDLVNKHRRKNESQIRKLGMLIKKLNETKTSPEDEAENELLRSVYKKVQNRSNAKLSNEEQAVLDKYGIVINRYANPGYRNLVKGKTELTGNNRDRWESTSKNYGYHSPNAYYGYNGPRSNRGASTGASLNKINLVDRARKADARDAGRVMPRDEWGFEPSRGYIGHNTGRSRYRKDNTYQSYENKAMNYRLSQNYRDMQSDISTKKDATRRMANAQSEYDNDMAYAKSQYDKEMAEIERRKKSAETSYGWRKGYADRDYERNTIGAKKEREAAQDRIDTRLKKKPKNENLTKVRVHRNVSR